MVMGAAFGGYRYVAGRWGTGLGVSVAVGSYGAIMVVVYGLVPGNPDPVAVPESLVGNFRLLSFLGQTVLWGVLGLVYGGLWVVLRGRRPGVPPRGSATWF